LNRKLFTCAGFAAATLLSVSAAQAQVIEKDAWAGPEPEAEGQSVVIEFEHRIDGEEQEKMKPGTQDDAPEIEFIIGGQGEDGIAKRGVLKIKD